MMRRLLRHAITVLSALSLLLCAATVVLWVRSYHNAYFWEIQRGTLHADLRAERRSSGVYLGRGRVKVMHDHRRWPPEYRRDDLIHADHYANLSGWGAMGVEHFDSVSYPLEHEWRFAGWRFRRFKPSQTRVGGFDVVVPLWFVCSVMLLLPMTRLVLRFWKGARRTGLCPQCGYDLRATPGRCPECGTAAAGKEA